MGGEPAADRPQRTGRSEQTPWARGYSYQVQVQPRSGLLRRWRGRIVTTDAQGRRRHWRWQRGFSKSRLMADLWAATMRDIQWRTGGAHSVEVVEPER